MDPDFFSSILDESMVLKLFGAFLGVIALLYFGFDTILNLSPTLKSFLLLTGAAGFFVAGDLLRSRILRAFLYVFSSLTYLSFLLYTIGKFNPGSEVVFLSFVASALLFIGMGYIRSEKEIRLTSDQSKAVLAGIVLLIFAVGIFDSMGARPEYSVEWKNDVRVVADQEFSLGIIKVRNNFLFSRNIDVSRVQGCMKAGGEVRRIYFSPEDGLIGGGTTETFNVTEQVSSIRETNTSVTGNYSVVQEECPTEPKKAKIYVTLESDQPPEFID